MRFADHVIDKPLGVFYFIRTRIFHYYLSQQRNMYQNKMNETYP